jgi:hypothetical protein
MFGSRASAFDAFGAVRINVEEPVANTRFSDRKPRESADGCRI